jgi:hypothetical protein
MMARWPRRTKRAIKLPPHHAINTHDNAANPEPRRFQTAGGQIGISVQCDGTPLCFGSLIIQIV